MPLAQGHNTAPLVRLELVTPQSQVKHSTNEPLPFSFQLLIKTKMLKNKDLSCFTTPQAVFILLINVKMPTTVGNLTFMSRINFMFS